MRVVGEAGTGEEALRLVREAEPDLVVLDLNLAGKPNGIELCQRIKAQPDAPNILIFIADDHTEDVTSRSLTGANGYLHKCSDGEELLDTMRRVAGGEKVWEAGELVAEQGAVIHVALEDAHLTPRELEVLAMKLRRRTNVEIANTLHISVNTVKHPVTSIYRKLEKSRKDLYRL
jgi:DNA-binding NarL/FixJ family response regulator